MVNDCSGFVEPMNLECMLINTFSGSMEVFLFVSLIAIAMMGTFFRMINITMLLMFALFAIIMAQYVEGFFFLILMVGGLIVSIWVSRIVKR